MQNFISAHLLFIVTLTIISLCLVYWLFKALVRLIATRCRDPYVLMECVAIIFITCILAYSIRYYVNNQLLSRPVPGLSYPNAQLTN